MKWQIIIISLLVFISMSFSAVWANDEPSGESNSQISTSNVASIAPLMKSSSSKSSSSSSSKTKIKDGDDDADDTADDSSGGFPWWLIIIIVVIILVVIGLVIWYLFLR
jgi:cobalamin biosynthesis Mg chelatase CobN